jgi:hypothetical protein
MGEDCGPEKIDSTFRAFGCLSQQTIAQTERRSIDQNNLVVPNRRSSRLSASPTEPSSAGHLPFPVGPECARQSMPPGMRMNSNNPDGMLMGLLRV